MEEKILVHNGFEVQEFTKGNGYPYDCQDKRRHPNSAVYYNLTGGWVPAHMLTPGKDGIYRIKGWND